MSALRLAAMLDRNRVLLLTFLYWMSTQQVNTKVLYPATRLRGVLDQTADLLVLMIVRTAGLINPANFVLYICQRVIIFLHRSSHLPNVIGSNTFCFFLHFSIRTLSINCPFVFCEAVKITDVILAWRHKRLQISALLIGCVIHCKLN